MIYIVNSAVILGAMRIGVSSYSLGVFVASVGLMAFCYGGMLVVRAYGND